MPVATPPEEFNDLDLSGLTCLKFGTWYRLNTVYQPNPLYFDRSGKGRFDGLSQSYGILYTGMCEYAIFAECFARKNGSRLITEEDLQSRDLWQITSHRPLILLRLHGNSLVQMGADAQVFSTTDYEIPRKWAEAIYHHPSQFDGIIWRSRLDNDKFCCGIFDRAQSALLPRNLGSLINYPLLLGNILAHYNFGLV